MKRAPTHLMTWGTFIAPHVDTASIADDSSGRVRAAATINITATVSNMAATRASVAATFQLLDSTGATIAVFNSSDVSTAVAGGQTTLRATAKVAAVNLWTLRSPTLYTIRTLLLSSNRVLDEENITVGFRSLEYTADTGFHLNNKHFKVRGFCDHNNFASVGMAVPDRVNLYRANAARSVGGNGRRMSHNPGAPSMFDIYDRVGMVRLPCPQWRDAELRLARILGGDG